MDLRTAVAGTLLPAGIPRLAAAFAGLRDQWSAGPGFLDRLWTACTGAALPPADRAAAWDAAAQALDTSARAGIRALPIWEPEYPPLLAVVADAPPVLWAKGGVDPLHQPAVAVVGSRAGTPYALQVAGRLGRELASRHIVVISGLARGVDSAAHEGCLEGDGSTVAVLGCGVDRIYPAEHRSLASRVSAAGAVISELPPGTPPLAGHFPLRNRIISGLSLAVVVVEAAEKSGSLITARCALEQGRDVMAVPGSVLSGRNRGSHALLKDGARIVESADDILQELGWGGAPQAKAARTPADPLLGRMAAGECYTLDQLAGLAGTSASRLLVRLSELELDGVVSHTHAGYVRKG